MFFQALQSELFRFKFHSLESKIQKIPEFNLIICNLSRKLPEIFMSLYVFSHRSWFFPGLTPLSIGHYWTIIQNDYLVKYILWPIMGMWSIKCVICMFFWCFNPWRQNPWIGKPSPGLGLLWTRSAVADCQSVADQFSFIIIYVLLFIWSTGIYKFCRIEKTNICLSDSPSFLLFPWSSEIIWSLSDRESHRSFELWKVELKN